MKFNGWTNRKTWNTALWIQNIESSSNRWCEATRTMNQLEWITMLQTEYPVTGDGVKLTDSSVNWDEIYSSIKSDWMA